MPMKGGDSDEYREIDRWDRGVGWIAHPGETMQRASHALVGDEGGLWVIDPVRSEEHTSELQSHAPISYAVFCLKKKK